MNKIPTLEPRNYDEIFNLYRQYIDPLLTSYKIGCSCDTSINNLYEKLLDKIRKGQITDLTI
jgi:hypothetical protein